MSFAIPFHRQFKYLQDKTVQLNIKYKPSIKKLESFIDTYKEHRINIVMENEPSQEDLNILKVLIDKFINTKIIIRLPIYNENLEQTLSSRSIPHYYNEIVTTWDKFLGFLSLDITDIVIAEELGFSALFLKPLAKSKNIQLRVFCNICQSSWYKTKSLKTFFIRPEDIDLYSYYFDTFEFIYAKEKPDIHEINVLYEVYAIDKHWAGRLDEIIKEYIGEEDSRFFLPDFAEFRLKCQKKCVTRGNMSSKCNMCERIGELSKVLDEKNLMIHINKEG